MIRNEIPMRVAFMLIALGLTVLSLSMIQKQVIPFLIVT